MHIRQARYAPALSSPPALSARPLRPPTPAALAARSYPLEAALPGLGRNFVARALLEAPGLDEALTLLTGPGQVERR
jgi:hypothetical protein